MAERVPDKLVVECAAVVMDAFQPLFAVEWLFGVVKLRAGARGAPGARERLRAAAAVVFYLYLAHFSLNTVSFNVVGAVSIELLPKCCMLLQFVTVIAAYMCLHGRLNERIYQTLARIDIALRVIIYDKKIYKDFKKTTLQYVLFMLFLHVVFNALVEVDGYDPLHILSKKLGLLFLYFFQDTETLFFCRLMLFIRTRLELINKHIRTIANEPKRHKIGPSLRSKNKKDNSHTIIHIELPELAIAYSNVAQVCRLVNSVFNLQILWTLITILCHIIVTIWASLRYYRLTLDNIEILIFISLWSISGLTNVVTISVSCERLQTARAQARRLLTDIIVDPQQTQVRRRQAKSFAALLAAGRLRVAVCGMFRVDASLARGFVALVTTYVIIILQISHFF